MTRDEMEREIAELRKVSLLKRTPGQNDRHTLLAHQIEDLNGNIVYGDTGEGDFTGEMAERQDTADGPLEEYDGED